MSTDTAERNKATFQELMRELDAGNIEIIYEIYDSAYRDHSGAESRKPMMGARASSEGSKR